VFDLISQAFDRPLNVLQMARPPNIEDGLREQDAAEPGAHRPLEDIVTAPVSWSYADPDDKAAIVKALTGQDVLVGAVFTREMGLSADSLKMIALPAAGFEKIASDAVPEGCVVVNAYEHEAPIAEWVMMAAEVLDHEVLKADRLLRQNDWGMWIFRRPPYRELFGRTMGVIGLGHIGRRVLKLARAYDMRLIAVTRTPPSADEAREMGLAWVGDQSQLGDLMSEADFIAVTTPQLPSTEGLVGEHEISLMKPDAYIINPARGPIIEETALYEALRDRRIGGAAIDVWWTYPSGPNDHTTRPSKYPFHELDNVLMTPHISGGTYGTSERRSRIVAENIDRFHRGEPLINVVSELSRV